MSLAWGSAFPSASHGAACRPTVRPERPGGQACAARREGPGLRDGQGAAPCHGRLLPPFVPFERSCSPCWPPRWWPRAWGHCAPARRRAAPTRSAQALQFTSGFLSVPIQRPAGGTTPHLHALTKSGEGSAGHAADPGDVAFVQLAAAAQEVAQHPELRGGVVGDAVEALGDQWLVDLHPDLLGGLAGGAG